MRNKIFLFLIKNRFDGWGLTRKIEKDLKKIKKNLSCPYLVHNKRSVEIWVSKRFQREVYVVLFFVLLLRKITKKYHLFVRIVGQVHSKRDLVQNSLSICAMLPEPSMLTHPKQ